MNFLNKFRQLSLLLALISLSANVFSGEIHVVNATNKSIEFSYSLKKAVKSRWKVISRYLNASDPQSIPAAHMTQFETKLDYGYITIGKLAEQLDAGAKIATRLCVLGASCAFGAAAGVAACPAGVVAEMALEQGLPLAQGQILDALVEDAEAEEIPQDLLLLEDAPEEDASLIEKATGALVEKTKKSDDFIARAFRFCSNAKKIPGSRHEFDFREDDRPITYFVTEKNGKLVVKQSRTKDLDDLPTDDLPTDEEIQNAEEVD